MESFWTGEDFFSNDYFNNLEILLRDVTVQRTAISSDQDLLQPLPTLPGFRPFRTFRPFRLFRPPRLFKPLMQFRTLPVLPKTLPSLESLMPLASLEPRRLLDFDRAFESNLENQRRAFTAARKAFDLTSNQAGYMHNFPTRYNNHGLGGFGAFPGFPMSGPGINSAFAGGSIGPGFTHQVAAINPKNPKVHNVNVMSRFSDTAKEGDKDFYSVSSSSFVTSSNVDGKEKSHRKAETVVNRNGEITQYKVED